MHLQMSSTCDLQCSQCYFSEVPERLHLRMSFERSRCTQCFQCAGYVRILALHNDGRCQLQLLLVPLVHGYTLFCDGHIWCSMALTAYGLMHTHRTQTTSTFFFSIRSLPPNSVPPYRSFPAHAVVSQCREQRPGESSESENSCLEDLCMAP